MEIYDFDPTLFPEKDFFRTPKNQTKAALKDIQKAFSSYQIWMFLSWQVVKQKYQRTTLGPFWITLSTVLFLLGIGPLYGKLMAQSVSDYLYFLSISYVLWIFISNIVIDACCTFINAAGYIQQINNPFMFYVLQSVWRNILIFLHNIIIIFAATLFWLEEFSLPLLTIPLGFLFIVINGICFSVILGMLAARYRDVTQLVASGLQMLMFITPIMWSPHMLKTHTWVMNINPLFHLMSIFRSPLMGEGVPYFSWLFIFCFTGLLIMIAFVSFAKYRSRIVYWVL